jgi:hypothetical protein
MDETLTHSLSHGMKRMKIPITYIVLFYYLYEYVNY